MSAIKNLSVFFLRANAITASSETPPVPSEIWAEICSMINVLPVNIGLHDSGMPCRYMTDKDDTHCLLFWDHSVGGMHTGNIHGDIIDGIIYKRRGANWPFLENGAGQFQGIHVSSSDESLAEITFFTLDKRRSVILFVSNPRAASTKILGDYFSHQWRMGVNCMRSTPGNEHFQCTEPFPIFLSFMMHPNKASDFEQLRNLSKMEISLSGGDFMGMVERSLHDSPINNRMDQMIISGIDAARCYGSRSFTISASINHDDIILTNPKDWLSRIGQRVLSLFSEPFAENRPSRGKNKVSITGKVDDQTRTIDLFEDRFLIKTSFAYEGRYLPFSSVFDKLHNIFEEQVDLLDQALSETF